MKVSHSTRLKPLEYQVLKHLEEGQFQQSLLIGVSGGLDSVALLRLLHQVMGRRPLSLAVIHVHHGHASRKQMAFRNKAWSFVQGLCQRLDVPFYSNLKAIRERRGKLLYDFEWAPEQLLTSEADFRGFRHNCFQKVRTHLESSTNSEWSLALAHNREDLLETRLLRLIRGTGLSGLKAMALQKDKTLRPLLDVSRAELELYMKKGRWKWVEDPSNKNLKWMRNWVRHSWLPQLERQFPGAQEAIGRSLEQIVQESQVSNWDPQSVIDKGSIIRTHWLELDQARKRQTLAVYMRKLSMQNYGLSHVEEVLKRLDSPQKSYKFTVLKHEWQVTQEKVWAAPIKG